MIVGADQEGDPKRPDQAIPQRLVDDGDPKPLPRDPGSDQCSSLNGFPHNREEDLEAPVTSSREIVAVARGKLLGEGDPQIEQHSEVPITEPVISVSEIVETSAREAVSVKPDSWTEIIRTVSTELQAAGITRWDIVREGIRGSASSALKWGSTYAVFNLGVEALADRSPVVVACAATWAACGYLATRLDRTWSDNIAQYGRQFGNHLSSELLKKHGLSSYEQLNDPDFKAEKELQQQRASDVEGIIRSSADLPSQVVPFALSVYVLLTSSDWTTALLVTAAVACAVVPQIRMNFRHAREDVDLEEQQARKSNIVDKIVEGAYSTAGSARMIIGKMTDRVAGILRGHNDEIDQQKAVHERRQTHEQRWPDRVFYGSIVGGMGAVIYRALSGSLDLGDAFFSMKILSELGEEVEEHAETAEGYKTSLEKIRRFYRFLKSEREEGTALMPDKAELRFEDASFVRGLNGSQFTAYLPDCQPQGGDLIVVHGASGAGKTTLIKHLVFACEPATGAVSVGGVPVSELNPDQWYGAIRYCAATPSLQEGFTVRQALTLDQDGEKYLDQRLAHPLIRDLIADLHLRNHGLDTVIGEGLENSRELSTGETHRLALVMAIVPAPKILFLDEVSSNQDDKFVDTLARSIEAVRGEGTIVIFATHSKQFDDKASHIVKISRGKSALIESQEE